MYNFVNFLTADHCKERWTDIRVTYMRIKKKREKRPGTLSKNKWPLLELLSFLDPVYKIKYVNIIFLLITFLKPIFYSCLIYNTHRNYCFTYYF